MKEMQKEIKDMFAIIHSLKVILDKQKQYYKRNCLLIHGLAEERNENTDQIVIQALKEKMKEEIRKVDLH